MRYALVADLHGRRRRLVALLDAARAAGAESLVVAGDYLECRVSKAEAPTARPDNLADVVDLDPGFWELLQTCTLVRGNQEERISGLVRDLPGVEALRPLLAAPIAIDLAVLTVTHGHTFDWSRLHDRWVPTLDDALPEDRVVVFGHSHQPLITTLVADGGTWRYHDSFLDPDRELRLDPDLRYLVNLAPAKKSPLWLLYDEDRETIAWRTQ